MPYKAKEVLRNLRRAGFGVERRPSSFMIQKFPHEVTRPQKKDEYLASFFRALAASCDRVLVFGKTATSARDEAPAEG